MIAAGLLELPASATIALNALGLPSLQLGLAWLFTQLPARWFRAPPEAQCERLLYEYVFMVKLWKDRLPDGAAWLRGFGKRRLEQSNEAYVQRFILETRRGELCHWCALAIIPVFFLWNPWWGKLVIASYALLANVPCIVAQRYNRIRLKRLLSKRRALGAAGLRRAT